MNKEVTFKLIADVDNYIKIRATDPDHKYMEVRIPESWLWDYMQRYTKSLKRAGKNLPVRNRGRIERRKQDDRV